MPKITIFNLYDKSSQVFETDRPTKVNERPKCEKAPGKKIKGSKGWKSTQNPTYPHKTKIFKYSKDRQTRKDKLGSKQKVKRNISICLSPLRNIKKKLLVHISGVRTPPQKKMVLRKRKTTIKLLANAHGV